MKSMKDEGMWCCNNVDDYQMKINSWPHEKIWLDEWDLVNKAEIKKHSQLVVMKITQIDKTTQNWICYVGDQHN